MKKHLAAVFFSLILSNAVSSHAQESQTPTDTDKTQNSPKQWYDRISIRGYTQVRYNRLLETNADLKCDQCDKSWGDEGGFYIRRARVVFSGQLTDHVSFYIQPDFASAVSSGSQHFVQLRDAYVDVGLDAKNEFRFRIGQSKVPYGFEALQSSQNRLPLDRSDPINSAAPNERDLGVMFYWAPDAIRERFKSLVRDGLKGSGDYGVVGIGAYNGQSANKAEGNDSPHIVARVSYPIQVGNQILEPGIQGYTGRWVLADDQISPGNTVHSDKAYRDQRAAVSLVLYPKPFGFQAEYNMGEGPEFDPSKNETTTQSLHGGYGMVSYWIHLGNQSLIPYSRYQYYHGGKKQELDARSYDVHEVETGVEWQPSKALELTAAYTYSNRRFEDFKTPSNHQEGRLLRLQAQFNY